LANARSAGPAKSNQKVSPLTYGPSLRLGVPSLRHSSGGIASGRLRFDLLSMCSASPNGAARPPPDERLHSACRGGGWIKIKSCRRAKARPVGAAEGCDLLILILRPLDMVKNQMQERTCSRRRSASRPDFCRCPQSLWERACSRRRPASRPISFECTQSNCGSEPAREGGLPADLIFADVPNPCGSGLARDGGLPANQSLTGKMQCSDNPV